MSSDCSHHELNNTSLKQKWIQRFCLAHAIAWCATGKSDDTAGMEHQDVSKDER